MKNSKKLIFVAEMLTGAGVLICLLLFTVFGFNFKSLNKKLSTVKYISNTYTIGGTFENISINADGENINFVKSDDGNCKVICYEEENESHNVRVENNTLMIDSINRQKVQVNIGVVTESPEITLYLPENEYEVLTVDADTGDVVIPKDFSFENMNVTLDTGDVSCFASAKGSIGIKTDTGDISVSGISANDISLSSDTGRIDISDLKLTENINVKDNTGKTVMKNVSCKKFTSNGDTGSLVMDNVIASDEFNLKRETGNIELNGCDAQTIYVKTDTGNVTGILLSEKVFITETDTGNVSVPKTIMGGRCEVTTDTGNIKIKVQE